MKRTVVILLSDKRSGSTLVQRLLCAHPEIQHVHATPHTYHETHHWLKAACVLRRPAQLFDGGRRYTGYGSHGNARRYMLDTIRSNVPSYTDPGDDEALVYEGWEALCETFADPVFFEKSPQVLAHWAALDLMLAWRERTSFDVRIIGLVRNPMAVMYSARERFATDPDERQFGWARAMRNLLAVQSLLPTDAFQRIRYEDLVDDAGATLSGITRWLGCRDMSPGGDVHGDSLAKWRDDESFGLQLDSAVARLASRLGYIPEDLNNPHAGISPVSGSRLAVRAMARFYDRHVHPWVLKRKGGGGHA